VASCWPVSPEASRTARASSFGNRAADYDRARPEYSAEAIDLAAARLGLGAGSEVLDLGAGTGKLTRTLVDRFARVTAVEPDQSMLAVLTQVTDCHLALEGRAEAIPLAGDSVDAVFVGQAFHWFDTDAALPEIVRVLRPRGGLVLIWNTWWKTEPPIPPAAQEVTRRVSERPGLERHALETDEWRMGFDSSPFEPLREEKVEPEVLRLGADRLVTLYLSTSVFGTLPPDELAQVEEELRRLIVGEYDLPIGTELYWTRLAK
jgi:ubiquinone/menaquinone biosynthesis C-methylase UbiE